MAGRSRGRRRRPACGTPATGPPSRTPRRSPAPARTPPRPAPRHQGRCRRRDRSRQPDRSLRSPVETARASAPAPPRAARPAPTPRHAEAASAEGALQLLEEAFVGAVRVVRRHVLELLEQAALLVCQLARDEDVHHHAQVTAPEAPQDGETAASQHAHAPRLGAGLERQLHLAVQRRHRDGGAERRLRERQVDLAVDVVAFADEALVRLDADLHVDVTSPASEQARMPFTREPDPLSVVDPCRNLYLERALLQHSARAVALLARVLDPAAGPAARGASLRAHELPEDAARDLSQPSGAATGRAGADSRPRFGAVAAAAFARNGDLERHLPRRPARRVRQLDLDTRGDIRSTAPPCPPRHAEQVVTEEGREEIGQIAEIERRRLEASAPQPGVPEAVVKLPPLAVRKDLVGLDDLAEPPLPVPSELPCRSPSAAGRAG